MIHPNTFHYRCILRAGSSVARCPHRRQLAANLRRQKSTLTTFRPPTLLSPRPKPSIQAIQPVHRRLVSTLRFAPLRRFRSPTLLRIHNRPMSALLSPRRAVLTNLSIPKKTSPICAVHGGRALSPIAPAASGIRGMKVKSSVKKRCEGCRVRYFFLSYFLALARAPSLHLFLCPFPPFLPPSFPLHTFKQEKRTRASRGTNILAKTECSKKRSPVHRL